MLLKEIFCDKITTLLEIVEILQNNWKQTEVREKINLQCSQQAPLRFTMNLMKWLSLRPWQLHGMWDGSYAFLWI